MNFTSEELTLRELHCPKNVNPATMHDQLVVMVNYQEYIIGLQSKLSQVMMFKADTMELTRRFQIPGVASMLLRGICVDEPNNMLYICSTRRLFSIQIQNLLILESPEVEEINISGIVDNLEGMTGTMAMDSSSGFLYVGTSTTMACETTYSILKMKPFGVREHIRVDMLSNNKDLIVTIHPLSEVTTLVFTARGQVLYINSGAVVSLFKRLEDVSSLHKAIFDPLKGMLYAVSMRIDRIWKYSYGAEGFELQGRFDTRHACNHPTPMCFLPQEGALTIFDNYVRLFKKWSFMNFEDSFSNDFFREIVDEYDSSFMSSTPTRIILTSPPQEVLSNSGYVPSLAELHHGNSPEFSCFETIPSLPAFEGEDMFSMESSEAFIDRGLYKNVSFSPEGLPITSESALVHRIIGEGVMLPELPVCSPDFVEGLHSPLKKQCTGSDSPFRPFDLMGPEIFGYGRVIAPPFSLVSID